MPLTAAERQAERRKRLKEQDLAEVRGIIAPIAKHAEIKAQVRRELEGEKK